MLTGVPVLVICMLMAEMPAQVDGGEVAIETGTRFALKARKKPYRHGKKLSIAAQEADIHMFLKLLADVTRTNVVISDDVGGNITRRLESIHWDLAFRKILDEMFLNNRRYGKTVVVAAQGVLKEQESLLQKLSKRCRAAASRARSVDLDFTRADLRALLCLIADISGRKILVSKDVQGQVSILARNLPWNRILLFALQSKELYMIDDGHELQVARLTDLAKGQRVAMEADCEAREKTPSPPGTPVQIYGLDHYTLVAVIYDTPKAAALVVDTGGKGSIVRQGTRLGKNHGKVTRITGDQVVVEETLKDFEGKPLIRRTVLKLGHKADPLPAEK